MRASCGGTRATRHWLVGLRIGPKRWPGLCRPCARPRFAGPLSGCPIFGTLGRGSAMAETRTLQQVVLGEILPHVGRRSAAMAGEARVSSGRRRGSTSGGAVAVMSWNALRVPQSVVKRVGTGGCHSPKELRRQMKYILRDEARVAAWSNQIGIDRVFGERGMENVIADWSAS